jgi:microcystin-dependent protein
VGDYLMAITLDGTTGIDAPAINAGNIVGQVCFFAMTTAPAGFLKANGAAVSRSVYANLFAAIGTTYGAGDGSTTFNLPDYRGEFPRGLDDGRGVDSGRGIGTAQSGQNASHTHQINGAGFTASGLSSSTGSGYVALRFGGVPATVNNPGDVLSEGGTEARPRNVAALACIKF